MKYRALRSYAYTYNIRIVIMVMIVTLRPRLSYVSCCEVNMADSGSAEDNGDAPQPMETSAGVQADNNAQSRST